MRRFELAEGSSSKFWEITVDGSSYSVRYGRIGTNGQTQTKSFESEAEAQGAATKVTAEKVKKGYLEVGAGAPVEPVAAVPKTEKKARAAAAPAEAPTGALTVMGEIFLVQGDAEAQKFWCGEAVGDTTRITTGKFGKNGTSTVTRHADAAKASALVDAEAAKQRKKGFAPVSSVASADGIPVLIVPKGAHAHEGARLLINEKELLCALCGSSVDAAEVSAHRLPRAFLGTLAFPTVLDLGADLKRARILAEAVKDLAVSSVWESRSLVGGKPKPAKKLAPLAPEDQLVAVVFGRILERTAQGEGQLAVLKDVLLNAPPAEAAAAAGLMHGSNGGLRPVEVYNPVFQPTPTWLWRLQQTADNIRESLADLSDRVTLARLLVEAADTRGGALIDAVCWPLSKSAWDWLNVEDHDKGRRLLLQTGSQLAEGSNPGARPLVISGVVDVQKWWSILERVSSPWRDHLVSALKRSPWPAGPVSIITWLNAHPYEEPGRARILDALRDCGHPDKVTFAFSREGTPDAAATAPWIPFDAAKGRRLTAEEWTAKRATEPWPHRATCAGLELKSQGRAAVVALLRDLAWQVWSVTGRYVPRKDLDGSPLDDALLMQWRDELIAASAQATVAPILAATSSAPDASAFQGDVARKRDWHASLHRRAKELVAQMTPIRLGAAWAGAMESGPLGTRHRSAIFSHALLDALHADVAKCSGDCNFNYQEKRSITECLNVHVRLNSESEAAEHAPHVTTWRNDWECFRDAGRKPLSVPFSFVLWDLESYLAEVKTQPSPDGVERLVRLLALWDQALVSMAAYESDLRIPAIARHLVGEKELVFHNWPNWREEMFASGFPGWGLLRGTPPLEAEMLIRALLAPPFFGQEGVVRDALLGAEGLAAFRATPSFPVPRLFPDAAARTAMLPTQRAPRGTATKPAVEVKVLHVTFECSETRVGFQFKGPKGSDRAATLMEHTETSYPGGEYHFEQAGEVATFRFSTFEISDVMDHLLDMNDGAPEKVLDAALREAVSDATHSDGLVIEVRS